MGYIDYFIISMITIGAYALGSLNSAILFAKIFNLPDPRTIGSGNPGTTNILRTGNKLAALLTLLGDLSKGLIPVLIAKILYPDPTQIWIYGLAGLSAFLGHVFPLYFQFKGGKGVATALGILLAFHPFIGLESLATWLLIAFTTRYSSLSALTAGLFAPLFVYLHSQSIVLTSFTIGISLSLYWRHTSNIQKLLTGQESKIGQKKK